MSQTITGVIAWLKGWFFDKDEITTKEQALQTQINNKASQTDLNTLSSTVGNKADKNGGVAQVTDANASAYTNIGSLNNGATQQAINNAINSKLGSINVEVIKVVTNKGTASASTMNKLYIEVGNNKTDVYYTKQNNSNYVWQKLDSDILDDLSIAWSDITNKPSTFAPSSHTHYANDITVEYNTVDGYAVSSTLDNYVDDVQLKFDNIDVPKNLSVILTHIEQYYNMYQ